VNIVLGGSQVGVNYQLYQNGNPIQAVKPGTGATLSWTVSGLAVGSFTFTVIGTNVALGCTNAMSGSVVVTVNPIPTVNAVGNQTVCNGSPTAAVNFAGAVPGTVFTWSNNNASIGLGGAGTGNIPSFTAINTGTAPVTATITVTPSYTNGVTCVGPSTSFTITVNPTPSVDQPANQVVCNNAPTLPVVFTGPVAGTVFNWTNNNATIGLGASGTGNIPSFTAINTGLAPVVATVTVTPVYTTLSSVSFTSAGGLTIPSSGTANPYPLPLVVSGLPAGATVQSVTITNLNHTWTGDIDVAITGPSFVAGGSIQAAMLLSDLGNDANDDAINTNIVFQDGAPPVPNTNPIPSGTYRCTNDGAVNDVMPGSGPNLNVAIPLLTALNGPTMNGTWNLWVNDQVGGDGGSIGSYTITFALAGASCPGTPKTFTYTVNPTAVMNTPANQTLCNGATTTAVNFTSANSGGTVTYAWTNNTPSIGLAASGTGNIAPFIATNTTLLPGTARRTVKRDLTQRGGS